jgi:hypothetical protein
MKKTAPIKSHQVEPDDMHSEYSFDYLKARPNRFAGRIDKSHLCLKRQGQKLFASHRPEPRRKNAHRHSRGCKRQDGAV